MTPKRIDAVSDQEQSRFVLKPRTDPLDSVQRTALEKVEMLPPMSAVGMLCELVALKKVSLILMDTLERAHSL